MRGSVGRAPSPAPAAPGVMIVLGVPAGATQAPGVVVPLEKLYPAWVPPDSQQP